MMERRFTVVAAVLLVLFASVLAVHAQQAAKLWRIGVLRNQPPTDPQHLAFLRGLRELGYQEGKNITIKYRWGELSAFPEMAKELVRLNVHVILAPNPQGAWAARQATTTIPIVFSVVGDPVKTGLVASLARPGGNVTGLTSFGSDLVGKKLELLKELVPRLSRVAVLWNPTVPDKVDEHQAMEGPARAMNLELHSFEVRSPGDVEQALGAVRDRRVQALLVLAEPLTFAHRARIVEFAAAIRLPTMFHWYEAVQAGGLISYGPSIPELYRRSAYVVDKILKGTKPADLPVEQPTKMELVINRNTAKTMGLTIPPSMLLRADHVIE